jgi:hypothetical protein
MPHHIIVWIARPYVGDGKDVMVTSCSWIPIITRQSRQSNSPYDMDHGCRFRDRAEWATYVGGAAIVCSVLNLLGVLRERKPVISLQGSCGRCVWLVALRPARVCGGCGADCLAKEQPRD